MLSIIAIIGKNRELGKNGQLVFNIKRDMQFFKEKTDGHTVVMGHRTWESLPDKLKNRKNIVVSHNPVDGADETITDINSYIKQHQFTHEEIYIIGGSKIYELFLNYAKNIYLTEVEEAVPDADTFFPVFDKSKYNQEEVERGDNFKIVKYIKK